VDLTSDDSSTGRLNSYGGAQSSQSSRQPKSPRPDASDFPLTQTQYDDELPEMAEQVDQSQSYDDQAYRRYSRYGTLHNKVVGLRYYNGYASTGEMVIMEREPNNQYDPNAIKVLNVHRDQIGHIPRALAAKLATYLVCIPPHLELKFWLIVLGQRSAAS
jgi:SWI/SNF-related matrix-associated actin-dependent regulator of chromatin subfamily A3